MTARPVEPDDGAKPDKKKLDKILGDELADKLIEEAATDPDLYWIASHPEAYADGGSYQQTKLMKLATNEPEAVDYVRNYPDRYPDETAAATKGSVVADDTKVPHLYQWDMRWGYTEYCSTGFGLTGCNPPRWRWSTRR